MATTATGPWPDELFDFAFIPASEDRLKELAELAEDEDWTYHNTPTDPEHQFPALFHYVRFIYKRVAEEGKISTSKEGQYCCFNTGLVTADQEPLYASFETNRREGVQPWFFKGWFRRGQWELSKFPELPALPHYFDDPACLVMDVRKDFQINVEYLLNETPRQRFPEPYRQMTNYSLQNVLRGAIDSARERVRRSYKTAIPQYYHGQVWLLLPLCLTNPQQADLALVMESHTAFYRATTCLTLEMAYNNARRIARPDKDWLRP